jgi:iron complex outermembrane receptor protein
MKLNNLSKALIPCAAAAVAALPVTASAQLLEEVVVTAQKREQNLQEVPISVSALTGEQVAALGLRDFTEITQQIPALQLNTWSPNLTIFNIRGISQNSFTDNLEGPIAVYHDDAYVASMNGISGQLFDIQRVEVLRGPQGTLFGRNATGGLIHYISQDASAEETNGYIEAEIGDYSRRSLEGAIGGSFTDNVRYRVAGRWSELDGYVEGVDTLVPDGSGDVLFPGSGQDLGGADGFAVRANLQVDFSDALQGSFWVKYSEDNDVDTGGYVFENCELDADGLCPVDEFGRAVTSPGVIDLFGQPTDPHLNYSDHPGILNRDQTSLTAKFDYALDNGMEFTSITNYLGIDKYYDEDGDALAIPILTFQTFIDYEQISQEFRLTGETDRSRWQVGFYYLDIDSDNGTTVTGAPAFGNLLVAGKVGAAGGDESVLTDPDTSPFNGFGGAVGDQVYLLNSKNWSVFGQADFDLTDRLTLTAGLRWSQDDKDINQQIFYVDNFNPTPLLVESSAARALLNPGVDNIDYGDWAGRLALNYQLSDTTIVFGSVDRGIKGGNWSTGVGANVTEVNFRHDEETVIAYQAGFKSDFERSRLNATAFYYDYSDYQAFSLAGGGPFVGNSDASSYGGEVEWFLSPTDRLDIVLGGAYIDSEVDRIAGIFSPIGGGPSPGDITNVEFPNAPKLSFNYLFRYNFDMFGGNLAAQVDGAWYDDQYLEITNGTGTVQPSYNVSNARLTYTGGSENFSVSAWVRNFTDEQYKVYSLDLGDLGVTTFYAPPIMYGVNAKISF